MNETKVLSYRRTGLKKISTLLLACFLFGIVGYGKDLKRVVSLTPSITENIYLIGAKDKLVGCTSYCTTAVNNGVEQVGSAVNVNVEKLFLLQPDIVFTMKLTKPQDVAAMKKLGIQVEVMETPKNFEEICAQTIRIAALLGHEQEAQKVIAETKDRVKEIRKKTESLKGSKIFFQIGANPIFTVLENTFMDDYITYCNGQNIAAGMTKGTITRESVLVKNPDVVVIATMGGFGKEEQKIWNSYSEMSAVKNKKVFLIDSETSCSPTPINFISALEDMYNNISQ